MSEHSPSNQSATIKVTKFRGGSATTGKRPFGVRVNGVTLRDARGVGRCFASYEAAEKAGQRELVRRLVQAGFPQ